MPDEVVDSQGTQQNEPVAQDGGGLNPAWNEVLSLVPEELHSQITPHLSKWDKNVQSKINEVHSQYEPYKPYVEKKVAPESINYALELLEAANTKPMEVIKALTDWSKQTGLWVDEQQGQIDESEIPSEFLEHPKFKQIEQMVQTIAQTLVQQNQSKAEQEENEKLDAELKALESQYEYFDADWILGKALQNPDKSLEEHTKAYQDFVKGLLAKQQQIPPGPVVQGRGGQPPNNQVDVASLDGKGRRNLITQMIKDSLSQSQ